MILPRTVRHALPPTRPLTTRPPPPMSCRGKASSSGHWCSTTPDLGRPRGLQYLWRALDGSVAAIGIAAAPLEGEAVMLAERADRVRVLGIGVGIRHADDDRPETAVVA